LKDHYIRSAGRGQIKICEAYAPLGEMVEMAHRFGLDDDLFIPIIRELNGDRKDEWMFLEQLGVRFIADLNFYLKGLEKLSANSNISQIIDIVFEAYGGIEKTRLSADDCSTLR
jgi:hypothetical protein